MSTTSGSATDRRSSFGGRRLRALSRDHRLLRAGYHATIGDRQAKVSGITDLRRPGWELVDNAVGKLNDSHGEDQVYAPVSMGSRT